MAPLRYLSCRRRKVLLLSLLFGFLFVADTRAQSLSNEFNPSRRILSDAELIDDPPVTTKKKPSTFPNKNQTKLVKPTANSSKNQTKLVKSPTGSPKNQTKLIKLTSGSTKNKTKLIKPDKETLTPVKTLLKKVNSTSKASSSTKPSSNLTKKASDLTKLSPPKNKTAKTTTKQSSVEPTEPKPKSPGKNQSADKKPKSPKTQNTKTANWLFEDEDDDLVAEFRDLPTKFQATLLPDLEQISTTSKVYLSRYNKHITKGFKPYVGTKYANTVASTVSFAFIIIPLILVSLIFHRIKAYFSLQKLLIFIQVYLSIYFSILCSSSLVTGLEPLRFFYATSQSTYICLQVLQTLGYVLYLLLLLMYLVLVFSTETGPGSKILGLAQTLVGFAVGLHYYVTVFHRVVLRQPPRTSWKVHGIYATCFLVICLLARADRRKKAYLEEGGEEGKKS